MGLLGSCWLLVLLLRLLDSQSCWSTPPAHARAGYGLAERPPDELLPEFHADDPDQVHTRLKEYVRTHFDHHLKCVEKGLIDPYDA